MNDDPNTDSTLQQQTNQPVVFSLPMNGTPRLARSSPTGLRDIRCLTDEELSSIIAAKNTLTDYMDATAMTLVARAADQVRQSIATVPQPTGPFDDDIYPHLGLIATQFTSWLLLWGMNQDHAQADIHRRHGKGSTQNQALQRARNDVYDAHFGYRIAEGLRDYAAHKAVPPVRYTGSDVIDETTGTRTTTARVYLNAANIADWKSCPAVLKRDMRAPNPETDLPAVIDDAMTGLNEANGAYLELVAPELRAAFDVIAGVWEESSPESPILIRGRRRDDGEPSFDITRLTPVLPHIQTLSRIWRSGGKL